MKIRLFSDTTPDFVDWGERFPVIGRPFRGEVGMLGQDDSWQRRVYGFFLFRRAWGVEVVK